MKKVLVFALLCLVLVGCEKEETKKMSCNFHQNDVVNKYEINSTYEITYSGKYVDSVTTIEEVESEEETILDYFEETLTTSYDAFQDSYDGYTFEITNENGKVKSVVTIDYTKMNLEQYVKDVPSMAELVEDGKVKFEGVKSLYESLGAVCEEE